jgi:hypothetical protein
MDAETIRVIAHLARKRAERSCEVSQGDGLSRLGAKRALRQFAADLDASADALAPRTCRKS